MNMNTTLGSSVSRFGPSLARSFFTVEVPISRAQEALNGMEEEELDRLSSRRRFLCCLFGPPSLPRSRCRSEAIWNSISRNNAATMRAVSLSCLARQIEKIEIEAHYLGCVDLLHNRAGIHWNRK